MRLKVWRLFINYSSIYPLFIFLFTLIIISGCKPKHNTAGAIVYSEGSAEFNNIIDVATQLHDSGYTTKAIHYLDSNFRKHPPHDALDIFHYYYFCFDHYNNHPESRDPAKAETYSDSMIRVLEKNKLTKTHLQQYAQAIFSKGDALFNAKRYTEAYKYFYKAKTIITDNVDPCALAGYSYRLGMVLYRQDKFQEASYYFKETFNEFNACQMDFTIFYRRQEMLDNIGLCFLKSGASDSAMSYFNAALQYINNNYYKFPSKPITFRDKANAVIYGNMAVVYSEQGDDDKAIALLQKSISINEQKGFDPIDAQLNRLRLASIYYKLHRTPDLKNILFLTNKINDSLPNQNVSIKLYDMMWQYYDKDKDVNNAFTYLLRYHHLRDSIDEQMKTLRETDLSEQLQNMDSQYQISILEKNNELKKTYLIVALLGAIMTAIIFLLFFNNWQKSKRGVKALTYLHNQVSTQKTTLEQLLKKLKESHTDKDRVLRAVAHDIRNPIAAISSLADLLVAEEYTYDAEQMELLSYIKNSCTDALSLTKEILEAADPLKAETLAKEHVDVRKIFTENIELLRFKASEKQQQINLFLPEYALPVFINSEKIWRVVSNLVTNAIKFSPAKAAIDVQLDIKDTQVYISVRDRGIGIPDNIKDKVFDMFTDAKRPGTSGEKPFGLGLSISRQIIEAHNGKIWFEPNELNGVTFYVSIPLDAA